MSQIIKNSTGGGGGDVTTLTPDSGGPISPISGNINIFGQTSGSVSDSQVVETTQLPTGTMVVENRAYITRYVVDPSSVIGIRGTYTDIQSAVTAAVSDGNSSTMMIYIRAGNYGGNVAIPSSAKISFVAFDPLYTISSGLWTFGTGCAVQFTGIAFSAPSGQISLTIPGNTICIFENCGFTGIDDTSIAMLIFGLSDAVQVSNCYFHAILEISGTTINGIGPIFQSCGMFSPIGVSGICSIFDSTITTIDMSGSASLQMYNCSINSMVSAGSAAISGSSSAVSQIFNCVFYSTGGIGISCTGTFILCGNTGVYTQTLGVQNLFNTNPTIAYVATQAGNISQVTLPAAGYTTTLSDSFVGINTSSSRSVNMYATPFVGLTYIIADVTGSAATNNITVNGNGSNIDGSSSYVIATNYASITLIYTGTIWKVI